MSTDISAQYQDLENHVRGYYRKKDFLSANTTLLEMVDIVKSHPDHFDEPEDRVRILRARSLMAKYQHERLSGRTSSIPILREVTDVSTPTSCDGQRCADFDPELCVSRRHLLTSRQKRMCVEKINAKCEALKLEAAFSARAHLHEITLDKRRTAVGFHKLLLQLDPSRKRAQNQAYLEYWHNVTEGLVALLNGDFDDSKDWFVRALEHSKSLNVRRCFPNYFRNVQELSTHRHYVDGVAAVSAGQFPAAREHFSLWLHLSHEVRTHLRAENIAIYETVCDLLGRLLESDLGFDDWARLDKLVQRSYVARPTWVLWSRLQFIRELSFRIRNNHPGSQSSDLVTEIRNIANQWNLFVPDVVLLGEDRTASLRRQVILPRFVDMHSLIDPKKHQWQPLLLQSLKNLFLVMADYEALRCAMPPPEEVHRPSIRHPPHASEKMDISQIAQVIRTYLSRRSRSHANIFDKAFANVEAFQHALEDDDLSRALSIQHDIFDIIRSWPHLIQVNKQEKISERIFLDEENPNFLARRMVGTRLWSRPEKTITFEGPQDLKVGTYYYLRPSWNTKVADRYRIRHEQFLQASGVARDVMTFYENIFGESDVDHQRFHDWILQFRECERLVACRLFSGARVFDEESMRKIWVNVFRTLPDDVKRDAVFVGLGHGAKSGRINPYLFRQGIVNLPEYAPVFSGREPQVFRDMAEYDEPKKFNLTTPRAIVFLDDFIGTGGQAEDFLKWYFPRYPWLKDVRVFLCTLVGFDKAVLKVKGALSGFLDDIIVGQTLTDADRAFSPENKIWWSHTECTDAQSWAEEIGKQILTGRAPYDAKRDALGWKGCQALIAFHHNVPSDTLPIFWATGSRDGRSWVPLWDRFD